MSNLNKNKTKIKQAATILLLRQREPNTIEALLLRRNKALNFASGFWVFPGGKVEATETAIAENELEAAKLAAAREAKEEANVDISPNDLYFFSHWTTPKIEPRRYATWFFFAEAKDADMEVQVDGSEVEEHRWLSPTEALKAMRTGDIILMPPTYITLQRISHCGTIEEVKKEFARSEPTWITPILELKDRKMYCLYKGDAGYETGKEDTPGPRHRLVGNMKKGEYEFFYSGCEEVFPVNGGYGIK